MAGGNASEAGDVRQIGIESHMPEYPVAFAVAELQVLGAHRGKFVIQVGFADAQVRYTDGAWTLDGRPPKGAMGSTGPNHYAEIPDVTQLVGDAVAQWTRANGLQGRPRLLEDRVAKAVLMVVADDDKRAASMAISLAKGENHPMFNMEAFHRVAHVKVVGPAPAAYKPPGRLWKVRFALSLAWAWMTSWLPTRPSGGL